MINWKGSGRKITSILIQNSRYTDRDSNPAPSEYGAGSLINKKKKTIIYWEDSDKMQVWIQVFGPETGEATGE